MQEPTTPSGSSSPAGSSVRHRQIQSCSARDFISKTQVRDRTDAPTAQVTVAQHAWKEMPPPGDELQGPHTPARPPPSVQVFHADRARAPPPRQAEARTQLPGLASADTGLWRTRDRVRPVSAVSPALPGSRFLQETASVPLPRTCQEPRGQHNLWAASRWGG